MNSSLSIGNVVNGFSNDIPDFEVWHRNIRLMKSICLEFNIKFISFLQPILDLVTTLLPEKKMKVTAYFYQSAKVYTEKDITKYFNHFTRMQLKLCLITQITWKT